MDLLVTLLYSLPVYQCLVLAVLLALAGRSGEGPSRMIMAMFLVLAAIYFSFNLLYNIRQYYIISRIYILILPVILLFIPVLYLYIVSVTTAGFRFRRAFMLHFIPSVLFLLLNLPFLVITPEERLSFVSMRFMDQPRSGFVSFLLLVYMAGLYVAWNLQIIGYTLLIRKRYIAHRRYISDRFSFTENISINWIRALIVTFIIFVVVNEMLYLFGLSQQPGPKIFYNAAMLWITLFAGYHGLMQKDLGREPEAVAMLPGASPGEETNGPPPETESAGGKAKYARSSLSAEQKQQLTVLLECLMDEERLYLDNQLTVDDVARRLSTNVKYISQVLNENYGRNFYSYINSYRVKEAQRLLEEDRDRKYSIIGISQMAGFSSKSSFNEAFRISTGKTPSRYRDELVAGAG